MTAEKSGQDAAVQEQTLTEIFAELREKAPKPTVEPNSQDWASMGGACAFHLIERHADNWADADLMMTEFAESRVKAAVAAERERCARVVEGNTLKQRQMRAWMNNLSLEPCELASKIRTGA